MEQCSGILHTKAVFLIRHLVMTVISLGWFPRYFSTDWQSGRMGQRSTDWAQRNTMVELFQREDL